MGRNICVPDTQFCVPADQGRPCPCDDNQTCCQLNNVCIPTGQSCGVPPQPEITHHPSRGARVPCAEKEIDSQIDGSMIQTSWTFIHDIWGNVTDMLGDRGSDNTNDYDSRWTYDIYGNLVGREEYADGALRYRRKLDYDTYGRLQNEYVDEDGDGNDDRHDSWDYHTAQPLRTTQTMSLGIVVSTMRCIYSMQDNGQPASYVCNSIPSGTIAERATYTQAPDRQIVEIASDGVNYDREIDVIHAAGYFEIDHYVLPGRQQMRHFVLDLQKGYPQAWNLTDQTRPDFPTSRGSYEYVCQ